MRVTLVALVACLLLAACSSPASTTEPTLAASVATPSSAPSMAGVESPTPSPSASEPLPAPQWAALEAIGPVPREDHTWTVDPSGEVAYLFGGRDREATSGDLWAYDLATDAWSEIAFEGGPAPRFGHEAVWVDDIGLVIFAGQADATTFFNDLWAYDPGSVSWRQLPSTGAVPVARYGTCAAVGPDGRLWISHGFTSENARFNDTLAYDLETGVWTDETPEAPLPVSRCLHGCWWTDGGELALFGGQTTGATALGDLWLLSDGAWTHIEGNLPSARNLYARARLASGVTLVFGGQALDETFLADAFLLNDGEANAVAVEPGGPAPAPRAGAEMIVDEARNRVLLFGGRDADRAYGDLWELRDLGVSLGP